MNRAEGFAVMDVSTAICEDPKFRLIQRKTPELVAPAFAAYMGVMAESWKAGKRVTIDHAWPAFLPFDPAVIVAMREAKLVDGRGFVSPKAWHDWFGPAQQRRAIARDKWQRANANRRGVTPKPPRGYTGVTAATVPSVRTAPSVPTEPSVPSVGSPPSLPGEEHLPKHLRLVNEYQSVGELDRRVKPVAS